MKNKFEDREYAQHKHKQGSELWERLEKDGAFKEFESSNPKISIPTVNQRDRELYLATAPDLKDLPEWTQDFVNKYMTLHQQNEMRRAYLFEDIEPDKFEETSSSSNFDREKKLLESLERRERRKSFKRKHKSKIRLFLEKLVSKVP